MYEWLRTKKSQKLGTVRLLHIAVSNTEIKRKVTTDYHKS